MKHSFQFAVLAALFTLAVASARADQTNLVQSLNVQLFGFQQGSGTTNGNTITTRTEAVRVSTSDIINALGAATGKSFSSNAQLVVVTALPNGYSSIQVRDGANTILATSFFTHAEVSGSVGSSSRNTRSGKGSATDHSIQRFAMIDGNGYSPLSLHFDVQGITVENSVTTPDLGQRTELSAEVSGAGDSAGALLILHGSVRVQGRTLEVITSGGGV